LILVEDIFDFNYEKTRQKLEKKYESPDFSVDSVKNELEALYIFEGQDWTGRGAVKQAEIEGAILAYQVFLKKFGTAFRADLKK
jgi:hypothetical protein